MQINVICRKKPLLKDFLQIRFDRQQVLMSKHYAKPLEIFKKLCKKPHLLQIVRSRRSGVSKYLKKVKMWIVYSPYLIKALKVHRMITLLKKLQ
jgi:hypothetical protein